MLTYNRENFVGRMIDCILNQTFNDFEFIIINNGSTDNSGRVADEYAAKDKRIKVVHRERGNIGQGRNTGLDTAGGEYITFVDDDDTCKPDYLQFLYGLAGKNNADAAICGATWADIDEKFVMTAEQAIETLFWRKKYNVAFPTKMFRRELFQQNRFLETGKYDDIYLMPKILSIANKVVYHGLSKYHFDRHANNNSAWTQNHKLLNAETLQEYSAVYDERTKWLCEKFPDSADKWEYFNLSFMLSMVEKVTRLEIAECRVLTDKMAARLLQNYDKFYSSKYILEFERKWMETYLNKEM
jgi:glycosyltransferase involved in cell wall biosynthesis